MDFLPKALMNKFRFIEGKARSMAPDMLLMSCWNLSLSLVDLIANKHLVSSVNTKGVAE